MKKLFCLAVLALCIQAQSGWTVLFDGKNLGCIRNRALTA